MPGTDDDRRESTAKSAKKFVGVAVRFPVSQTLRMRGGDAEISTYFAGVKGAFPEGSRLHGFGILRGLLLPVWRYRLGVRT